MTKKDKTAENVVFRGFIFFFLGSLSNVGVLHN